MFRFGNQSLGPQVVKFAEAILDRSVIRRGSRRPRHGVVENRYSSKQGDPSNKEEEDAETVILTERSAKL
jgi:hypothetical protein